MKRHTVKSLAAQLKAQGQVVLDIRRELDARGNLERANARDTVIRETERESDRIEGRYPGDESPQQAIRIESPFGDRVREPSLFDVVRTIEENRQIVQKNIAGLSQEIGNLVDALQPAERASPELVHEGRYYVDVEGVRVVSDSPQQVVNRR